MRSVLRSRRLSRRINGSPNRCRRTSVRADTGSARAALPRPGDLINQTPGFGRYLADRRIVDPCESIFGPYVRVSSVGAVMNHPGNARGYWHSDWPFNQTVASHVPAPYPDAVMHVTAIFMLSPFTEETGGTLVVPGSHRSPANPSGENGVDRDSAYPHRDQRKGPAGRRAPLRQQAVAQRSAQQQRSSPNGGHCALCSLVAESLRPKAGNA